MELAEVLLSGLLERLPDGDGEAGPRYAFLPGVHELLLRSLDQDTALLVLKHVSDFVTRRFGSGTRNFPALAVARLTGRPPSEPTAPTSSGQGRGTGHHGAADELFAEVPARVLRWYTPEVTMSGPPRAEAERLLARWWSQGDPGVLRQAREHAEAAVAAAGGAPGGGADDDQRSLPDWQAAELRRSRRVLGQVLHALTRTGEVRRRPGRAAELLHEAARQLTAPDPETCFDRVPVLHDLWRAEQDASYLLTAERELRAMPAGAEGPAEGRRRLWLGRTLLALARSSGGTATGLDGRAAATASAAELEAAAGLLASTDGHAEDGTLCDVLLDLGAALRHCDAGAERQLATVRRAEAAAGEDEALRLRCARARARVHRDVGDWDAADEAYASAERLTGRDGERRCALLTEWGTMLMDGPWHPDRAEGVLREALTGAPAEGPLASRVSLLLGRALLLRYRSEHFLPDLYEGSHLLEQAARSAGEPALRAEAWLRLGVAEQEFPAGHVRPGRARTALSRSLEEARRARDAAPGTLAVARALHASGLLKQRSGATGAALADFRAAAAEWQRLSGLLHAVPFSEVAETRDRIAALETG
jgi:tetratricopeptide (TPR) repeat protein